MDKELVEFKDRLLRALALAKDERTELEKKKETVLLEDVDRLLTVLNRLYKEVEDGTLRRPSMNAGWGMSRAVGEWASGTELKKAIDDLEDFYRKKM